MDKSIKNETLNPVNTKQITSGTNPVTNQIKHLTLNILDFDRLLATHKYVLLKNFCRKSQLFIGHFLEILFLLYIVCETRKINTLRH